MVVLADSGFPKQTRGGQGSATTDRSCGALKPPTAGSARRCVRPEFASPSSRKKRRGVLERIEICGLKRTSRGQARHRTKAPDRHHQNTFRSTATCRSAATTCWGVRPTTAARPTGGRRDIGSPDGRPFHVRATVVANRALDGASLESFRRSLAASPLRFHSCFTCVRLHRGLSPPDCWACPAHSPAPSVQPLAQGLDGPHLAQ